MELGLGICFQEFLKALPTILDDLNHNWDVKRSLLYCPEVRDTPAEYLIYYTSFIIESEQIQTFSAATLRVD